MHIRSGGFPPRRRCQRRNNLAFFLLVCFTAQASAKDPPNQLPDIVVSAHLVPGSLSQTGSSVSVITAEQIEQQKVVYVSDILRTVPGLAVNRSGGFGGLTQVRMRGAEANQTLVRIDGIEVNDPAFGSEYDFGNLLAVDIERIEILRGPQSALYGSDAIGGVINIITKRGRKGLRPTFVTEGGSFDTYRVGGGVSGGTGDLFDFSGGAQYFSTEGISSADVDNGNGERDANRNLTAYVNGNLRPLDNLEFGLTGRLVHNEQDLDGFSTQAFDNQALAFDNNDMTTGRHYYGRVFSKLNLLEETGWLNWEHLVSAGYSGNRRRDFGSFPSENDGTRNQYFYQTNLLMDTPDLMQSKHTLTFKLEHERDQIDSTSAFSDVDRSVTTNSYIGEYQLALVERLSLTGSVRHDDNSDPFKDQTTYRTTGSYRIDETDSRLHGSWGTGIKNPTLFQLYGSTGTFSGNPNLQAEKSRGFDVGVTQNFLGEGISLDLTYFNNRISNLIIGSGRTAVNVPGESRIEGIEASLSANIIDDLDFNGSYTWTSTKDSTGNPLVRRPKHLASAYLNYGFELLGRSGNFNIGVIYNGKQSDLAFDAFFNSSMVPLDDYTLLNIAMSYKIFEELELFARVQNALDQNYQEVFSFGSPGVAAYGGIRLAAGPFFE